MTLIRKFFSVFSLIMAVGCVIVFIAYVRHPAVVAELLMWVGIFALLNKKKRHEELTNEVPEEQNQVTAYIENTNTIYHTDNTFIAESEILYLQQLGREQAKAKMRISQLNHLIQESYRIMYTTNNPKTLCSRYDEIVLYMQEIKRYIDDGLADADASISFNKNSALVSDDNYCLLIQQCFKRYMQKAQTELKTNTGIEKRRQRFFDFLHSNVDIKIIMRLSIF